MTKNQIEYNKLLETGRANRANERLTANRDAAVRRLGLDTLRETARHNAQVELQARDNLAEQYRNNLAQLEELQRSHLASEGIAQLNADIAMRREIEAQRHNLAAEDLSLLSADVARLGAELGASSHISAAGISAAAAQYASDNALMARQLEVDLGRTRLASEVGLRTAELSESKRAAIARQAEINRANRQSETQKGVSLIEQARNNMVTNALNKQKFEADVALRGQQNSIAQQQADTAAKRLDIDLALLPSQKASNYARAVDTASRAVNSIASGVKTILGGR